MYLQELYVSLRQHNSRGVSGCALSTCATELVPSCQAAGRSDSPVSRLSISGDGGPAGLGEKRREGENRGRRGDGKG